VEDRHVAAVIDHKLREHHEEPTTEVQSLLAKVGVEQDRDAAKSRGAADDLETRLGAADPATLVARAEAARRSLNRIESLANKKPNRSPTRCKKVRSRFAPLVT
jgi:hypothetical protein